MFGDHSIFYTLVFGRNRRMLSYSHDTIIIFFLIEKISFFVSCQFIYPLVTVSLFGCLYILKVNAIKLSMTFTTRRGSGIGDEDWLQRLYMGGSVNQKNYNSSFVVFLTQFSIL